MNKYTIQLNCNEKTLDESVIWYFILVTEIIHQNSDDCPWEIELLTPQLLSLVSKQKNASLMKKVFHRPNSDGLVFSLPVFVFMA